MISLTLLAVLLHFVIVFTGLACIQLASPYKRINLIKNTPFGWGIGVVFLYLLSNFFVRNEILLTSWHFLTFALMLIVITTGLWFHFKAPIIRNAKTPIRLNALDICILIFIAIKVSTITYIAFVNPIIDADAVSDQGYIPLAKAVAQGLPYSEILRTRISELHSAVSPTLLTAWSTMFFDRWHISFVALPWLFSYFSIIGLAFLAPFKITRNVTASLICSYIFSSVYLLIIHTIRPGYHDAFVTFYFIMMISITTVFTLQNTKCDTYCFTLILGAFIGLFLSKIGGKLFSVLFCLYWLNYYLCHYRKIRFYTLLKIESEILFVLVTSIILLNQNIIAPYFSHHGIVNIFATLTPRMPHPRSFQQFSLHLFKWFSFGILWWLTLVLYFLNLLKKKTNGEKALLLLVSIVFLSVLYVCNFTVLAYSEDATTTGRFYLQIIGLLIPCFCIFIRDSSVCPVIDSKTSLESKSQSQ